MGDFSMARKRYPTDLSDAQWRLIEPYLVSRTNRGRPRKYTTRAVVDAIFYVARTGGAWRMLAQDFPPWETVYYHFRRWQRPGVWQTIHTLLREKERVRQGREPHPSAAVLDSQSVKTTEKGGFADTTPPKK